MAANASAASRVPPDLRLTIPLRDRASTNAASLSCIPCCLNINVLLDEATANFVFPNARCAVHCASGVASRLRSVAASNAETDTPLLRRQARTGIPSSLDRSLLWPLRFQLQSPPTRLSRFRALRLVPESAVLPVLWASVYHRPTDAHSAGRFDASALGSSSISPSALKIIIVVKCLQSALTCLSLKEKRRGPRHIAYLSPYHPPSTSLRPSAALLASWQDES